MPRTSCSQPPQASQSGLSGLLNLIQPPQSSATSILHHAVRSLANDKSASPLVRDLSALERRLAQLTEQSDCAHSEWEMRLRDVLTALCEVLQRVNASTVARPLNELFPELDALLLSLLPLLSDSSAGCRSLLLNCCGLLTRAATSTATAAVWPRWLLSSPSRPLNNDGALCDALTSTLASANEPAPSLLFSATALLASLCLSARHSTALSAYFSRTRLLPNLCQLYAQQCALVVRRVQALMERGQRRLLDDMWAGAGKQEWLLEGATDDSERRAELSDRQQLILLSRLQTIIEAVIRHRRHSPRHKATCDLCTSSTLFSTLLAAVASLWQCLLPLLAHLLSGAVSNVVHTLSIAALSLLYEATYKSKQQAAGGSSEVVGHISIMLQLLDPLSASAVAFYPLLLTVVEQLTRWLPESPSMCTSVLGSIACAVLEIAMAQRQKPESQVNVCPARPAAVSEQPPREPRLDLTPLMQVLLTAATECVRIVQTSAATVELMERVDSCTQATLEAHAHFFRHASQSDATGSPQFLLQTCRSLVPLACCILSLTAAAAGQPLSAVAILAVNLERLVESCEQRRQLHELLACAVQHGLIVHSWRAREALLRLCGQCQSATKDNSAQLKQLDTARRYFDRYLSALMAVTEWWQRDGDGQSHASKRWLAALETVFGGAQNGCVAVVESLHLYASWRTAAGLGVSDQLCLVLSLAAALLLSEPTQQPAGEQQSIEQKAADTVPTAQQLVLDNGKLLGSIEQLLVEQRHKQSTCIPSVRPVVLSREALLRVCLVLLLIERLHRRAASTRSKSALFGLLAATDVSAADVALSPPLQCCVDSAALGRWLWQQSTASQGAVLLHDQLLSSILSPPADSRGASGRMRPLSTAQRTDIRHDRIHQHLASVAELLQSVEASGPLQALLRRWRAAVQSWQSAQADRDDELADAQQRRSTDIEELLLCSAHLAKSCARKLASLDLLELLARLLASGYHRLLLPAAAHMADDRLFPAVEVVAWLLHTLSALLSVSAALRQTQPAQLGSVFDAACQLLLVFTNSDVDSSTTADSLTVSQGCLRLMNMALSHAATTADGSLVLLRSFTSNEHIQDAIYRLVTTGFSGSSWSAACNTNNGRTLRVQLPHASEASDSQLLHLLRLQLQVDCMRLCTALLLGSTDVEYAMLDWEQCMEVLSQPCDEMKAAAFHYLAACFGRGLLQFQQPAAAEQKYESDGESDKDWKPTEKGMDSAHSLLLAIQAGLYPRQRLSLSSAALDALQAMLEAVTASQRRELLDQPWHTFVLHSCLLSLAMHPSVHSTANERDHRISQLYRYLHLLTNDDSDTEGDFDPARQCLVKRHLKDVDSRLLHPLLFFPAIDDQPASQPAPVLCRTSVCQYLTLLQRLDRSHLLLPLRVRAQLPAHLRLLGSIVRGSCATAVCPAATAQPAEGGEQKRDETAAAVTSGSGSQSQLPSHLQHRSVSQHSEPAWPDASQPVGDVTSEQPMHSFVQQCVCSSAVGGAMVISDYCTDAIDQLLGLLEL